MRKSDSVVQEEIMKVINIPLKPNWIKESLVINKVFLLIIIK